MASLLALIGGEEFADGFEDVHAQLAEIAYQNRQSQNGSALRVAFLPTCAAHDGPEAVHYWSEQAEKRLGVLDARVVALQVIDQSSANDPENAHQIAEADWIYIGGGYPHIGMEILSGTQTLQALYYARKRGALISGASAGAMLLCARSWVISPELDRTITALLEQGGSADDLEIPLPPFIDCLGLVQGVLCWPHLNQFFSMRWVEGGMLPTGYTMLGVDEQTSIVSEDTINWQVLGRSRAVIIDPNHQTRTYTAGQQFNI
jgi:cyanophycinase-like exopeptidase